ncbi:AraC family transcriptional regulator [Paenibacillus sp. FSL H8-0034]|uniref:AraC family transcriptional regulator n=1 Tax=Paenibacillus sp. FSL H8-0034 TaxID=2954671 RepID=UPI0030F4C4AB
MKKPWFYRQLLYYLPVFFIVFILLSLLMAYMLNHQSKASARSANEVFAKHVLQAIDYNLQNIEKMLVNEMYNNHKLIQFIYDVPSLNDHFVEYEVTNEIKRMHNSSSLIDSIYIFRPEERKVFSDNFIRPVEQFGDGAFAIEAARPEYQAMREHPWTSKRIYKEITGSDAAVPVITLLRKIPLRTGVETVFVVNVKTKKLQELIMEMSNANVSYAEISGTDEQMLLDTPEVKSGVELIRLTSEYSGFTIHTGLINGNWYEAGNAVYNTALIVAVLFFIAGAYWIVFITRRNYRPIESMLSKLNSYSKKKNQLNWSEFGKDALKFIEHAIDMLIEQANELRQGSEEGLLYKRRLFFTDLVEGNRMYSREQWQLEMERLQLPRHDGRIGLAVLEIDKYSNFCQTYSTRDQYLLRFVLSSVIHELGETHGLTPWAEWTSGHRLGVLLQYREELEADDPVSGLCSQVIGWVREHLDFTVTMGIGFTMEEPSDILQSYQSALESLSYKTMLGTGRVIERRHTPLQQGVAYKSLNSVHSLAHAFRVGDEKWKGHADEFFEEIDNGLYKREEILHLLNYLLYNLYKEMMELQPELQELWKAEAIPALNELLDSFETIGELKQRVFGVLDDTWRKLSRVREHSSHHDFIQGVRKYIEVNYNNPELSLSHLEDAFKVNGKYISQLFRDEMGEKFIDYLANVRLNRAKDLLKQSALPVQDVALHVGYTNAMTFIRAFKKTTGTTPGEYRKV